MASYDKVWKYIQFPADFIWDGNREGINSRQLIRPCDNGDFHDPFQRRLIINNFLPKFYTENLILSQFALNGTNGHEREIVFRINLRRALYWGNHLLQISLKAMITKRQYLLTDNWTRR